MREFATRVFAMRRLSLAAAVLFAGCHSAEYELYLEQQEKFASNGSDSSGDAEPTTPGDTEPASTGAIGSDSAAGSTTDATDTTDAADTAPQSGTATDTRDASDTSDSPRIGEPDKPLIVSIELPANVYAAGPVALAVQPEHTGSVHVTLDGVTRASCPRRARGAVLYMARGKDYRELYSDALDLDQHLRRFGAVLLHLERFGYAGAPDLAKLCQPFCNPARRPSARLRGVGRIIAAASVQGNPLARLLFNIALPWDYWFAWRHAQEQQKIREDVPVWLDIWHELEAL